MGAKTKIEWSDATWSPLRARVKENAGEIAAAKGYTSLVQIATKMQGHVGQHCEHISDGCKLCYSGTNQARCLPFNGTGLPFDRRSRDLVDPIVDEKALYLPISWRKPRRIFVENQSDLFGDWHLDEDIDRVFSIMSGCRTHTFQVLTKRPERMLAYLNRFKPDGRGWITPGGVDGEDTHCPIDANRWPLPNVHLGVSVEDQKTADERIPLLRKTPAAVRFLSLEPLLEDLGDIGRYLRPTDDEDLECSECSWRGREEDARRVDDPADDWWFACPKCDEVCAHAPMDEWGAGIDWVIVGGESGPGARPMDIVWVRNITAQCRAAEVPCFVKQEGSFVVSSDQRDWIGHRGRIEATGNGLEQRWRILLKDRKGGTMEEWPADLRVREFPILEGNHA